MGDKILHEKVNKALVEMAKEHSISKIKQINIVINIDKHIIEKDLIEYLKSKDSFLFEKLEKVDISKEKIEMITAIITNIKGE